MDLGIPFARGNTADIYIKDGKLIKLFNDFLPDSEAEYEANKQRYAYLCGLRVPCIYDVTKINGKQAIVMEYIEGTTISKLIQEDTTKTLQYMELSIDTQIKIHKTHTDKPESMTDKLCRQLTSVALLSDKQKDALIDRIQSMKYEKRLCHGDYHLSNLIVTGNKVTVIDWVDATAGDIKADVYRTYLLYSQFSTDLANLHVQLYCEKSGLTKDEIFAWEPIIAGARLAENVSSENAERLINIVKKYHPT